MLHDLRRLHGPLGLLYGAYCPPDLHVRLEDESVSRLDWRIADDPTTVGGKVLGRSRDSVADARGHAHDLPLPESPYLPWIPTADRTVPVCAGRPTTSLGFCG